MKNNVKKLMPIIFLASVIVILVCFGWLNFGNGFVTEAEVYNYEEIRADIERKGNQYQRTYSEFGSVETIVKPITSEYVDYFYSDLYDIGSAKLGTNAVEDSFVVTKIIDSGLPDSDSIVIVFMGDGFTAGTSANQQGSWPNPVAGSFLAQAYGAAQTLINTHPFNLFSNIFTVYALQVISNDVGITGAPDGTGPVCDTYFQVNFTAASSITMPNSCQIQALSLANSVSQNVAMVQVLANTNAHGGVSFWGTYSDNNTVRVALTATQASSNSYWSPAWHGTVIHEFGHSFGQLMDEHDSSVGRSEQRANATQVSDTSLVKWSHWIGYEGITLRSVTGGWYVPAADNACVMRASWANNEFCAVCASELTRRLALFTDETFYGKRSNPGPNTPVVELEPGTNRILPYAFNGNSSLQSITIPTSVQSIGDYAFIGATGLSEIRNESPIPQVINDTTFAGVIRSNITVIIPIGKTEEYINAGWEGFNFIEEGWLTETLGEEISIKGFIGEISGDISIPEVIDGKKVTSIGSMVFVNQIEMTGIIIPISIKNIGNDAFRGCISLTNISSLGNVLTIGDRAFANCASLVNIIIPSSVTYIGDGAFAGCDNLNITVVTGNPNYSAANNILYNKNKTQILAAGNIAPVINIPDTVTDVLPSAFESNGKVTTLHFEGTTAIGAYAFADCENLNAVYFYTYTVPEVGISAFLNDEFTLYVPQSAQAAYNSVFVGYTTDIDSIQVTVTFMSGDAVVDTQTVYFGATINALGTAYKTGYDFCGWYDKPNHTGTAYEVGGLWDTTEDLTLYADLQPREFYITFNGYGSAGLSDKLVVYDSLIGELPEPEREGYTFLGWKDEYNTVYTEDMLWQQLSNVAVTSAWSVNEYTITYNGNGGTASAAEQSVDYGSVIASLATATRDGYVFTGWNTSADGSGQTVGVPYEYLFDYDITLYAQYAPKEYVVTFDRQGGTGGTAGVDAVFEEDMPEGPDITAPTRRGYTFGGYYREKDGKLVFYYNADMTSANKWDIDKDETLFAAWTPNTYVVELNKQDGSGGPESITVTFNSPMPAGIAAPSKEGYTFQGYYAQPNGVGTPYYDQDMASANNWNETDVTEIYAYYTANVYTVILDRCGGTGGSSSVEATYGSPMPSAVAPIRTGYTFQGYFQFENGQGKKYYNSNMSSAEEWDRAENNFTLYAYWTGNQYIVTLDNGIYGDDVDVIVTYGSPMPTEGITVPERKGYTFEGYYTSETGGTNYYVGPALASARNWDQTSGATLYARWEKIKYEVTLDNQGSGASNNYIYVAYGEMMPLPNNLDTAPTKKGYAFVGYFSQPNGKGTQYYSMGKGYSTPYVSGDTMIGGYYEKLIPERSWNLYKNATLYAHWELLSCTYNYELVVLNEGTLSEHGTVEITHGVEVEFKAPDLQKDGLIFDHFWCDNQTYTTQTVRWTIELTRSKSDWEIYPTKGFYAVYKRDTCIAEGSMITLADGTQKAVEDLTGKEMLLVWNLKTGTLDVAPILFIDNDPVTMYSVINLYFSDGTQVKVISEHGFWDYNLNKYVYLDKDAAQYIGHWFNKLSTDEYGNSVSEKAQLVNVVIQDEYTTAWSPVTYGHYCYYANGMLSMPGGIEGMFNIFEVDAETMKYDEAQMQADIAQYGLFTYEEFAELFPISEEVFEAFNGQYLKVAMGKGLIDAEGLQTLIERYAEFLSAIG